MMERKILVCIIILMFLAAGVGRYVLEKRAQQRDKNVEKQIQTHVDGGFKL